MLVIYQCMFLFIAYIFVPIIQRNIRIRLNVFIFTFLISVVYFFVDHSLEL